MKKVAFYDDEERKVITAYERGDFKSVKNQKGPKRTAVQTAKRYRRKEARINIRLSSPTSTVRRAPQKFCGSEHR